MSYKLIDIINEIKEKALLIPNIGTFLSGDIYQLNELPDIDYSVVCLTQGVHTSTQYQITFNFNLFYVDRLVGNTTEQSNKEQIQSTAVEVLNKILNECDFIDETQVRNIQVFTERFTSECAGAYIAFVVVVENNYC